jgi:2-polyprenyl-6-methoxyphenol hydroxylase-like FAD-dependent oxidoreductase
MGGAYLLAEALHRMPDYTTAFHHYEQQVRPHVEQYQKNARNIARTFIPESSLGLAVQRLTMKLLLHDIWRGLLRRQLGAEGFLPPQSREKMLS